MASLAKNFFISHAPATLQDFVWWSGLSTTDAKHALEMAGSDLMSEVIDLHTYWLPNFHAIPRIEKEVVYLLPAYDEFIISYKDRSAAVPIEYHKKSVSNNGIFRPVIVVNGQVTGIWKRTIKKEKVIVETHLFKQPDRNTMNLIEKAAMHYGHFLDKKMEIIQK